MKERGNGWSGMEDVARGVVMGLQRGAEGLGMWTEGGERESGGEDDCWKELGLGGRMGMRMFVGVGAATSSFRRARPCGRRG